MRHEPKTYAALLIALAVLLISPAAHAVTALEEWNAAAREALATPVKAVSYTHLTLPTIYPV